MTIRIVVNGAPGKMGQVTVKAVSHDPELQLVGQIGKDDNLLKIIKETKPDVVVDFTTPLVVYENVVKIIEAGVHPVVGTTGLSADQIAALRKRCEARKLGGILVPNFCIGAVLSMQFASQAAKYYPNVEIIEMHHPAKLDSPSGTALKTASLIAEARKHQPDFVPMHETIPGARGATSHNIPIHAVRLPGIISSQEVIFGGIGETISIRHNTVSREAYMPGIIIACKNVIKLKELVYGLEHVLK